MLAAAPAAHAAGVGVTQISSLPAGAKAGNLTGVVTNESDRAARAEVSVRVMRRKTGGALIGKTSVDVAAHGTKTFLVGVKVPNLKKGTYYVAACTPQGGADKGALGCATSAADLKIGGGDPVRGKLAQRQFEAQGSNNARAAQAQCSPGARTLVKPGDRVWPELGNGGYQSLHSDVFINYDAVTNKFLPGTHVELMQKSTQCLSEFSLDFDRKSSISSTAAVPGSDMTVQSITIDGVPATFVHRQPTFPGNPNGPDDPNPLAHAASNTNPVSATNPNPPACAPAGNNAAQQGVQCGETKLVITPAQPIPAGTNFKVVVNYVGQPGIRVNPSLGNEGWFKSNTPAGDGAMVTSEPSGSMAWMPLNNHVSVKPTYDVHSTVNYDPAAAPGVNRVFIGPGRLVSKVVNAPDANYPTTGSRTFNWHSAEPIGSYLVENSVGHFDESERMATAGDVIYYEYQSSGIAAARKATNKAIMDMQEDITHFQEQFNGPFPFNANGIVIALPNASFQEEMQTKIVFVNGSIGNTAEIFSHENMHQWWGDSVSYAGAAVHVLQGGLRGRLAVPVPRGRRRQGGGRRGLGRVQHRVRGVDREPLRRDQPVQHDQHVVLDRRADQPDVGPAVRQLEHVQPPGPVLHRAAGDPGQRPVGQGQPGDPDRLQVRLDHARAGDGGLPQVPAEPVDRLPQQARRVLQAVVVHELLGHPGDRQQAVRSRARAWPATTTSMTPTAAARTTASTSPAPAGGTVPATLSLTLGASATFGAFTPGVAKDYTATTSANVISTAGDATLSVTDPSSNAPGHLVNGAFSLPTALKAVGTSPGSTSAGAGTVSGAPLTLTSWSAPVSNDPVQVLFTQSIGANDALRTGTYAKTLTFTLSTTAP